MEQEENKQYIITRITCVRCVLLSFLPTDCSKDNAIHVVSFLSIKGCECVFTCFKVHCFAILRVKFVSDRAAQRTNTKTRTNRKRGERHRESL